MSKENPTNPENANKTSFTRGDAPKNVLEESIAGLRQALSSEVKLSSDEYGRVEVAFGDVKLIVMSTDPDSDRLNRIIVLGGVPAPDYIVQSAYQMVQDGRGGFRKVPHDPRVTLFYNNVPIELIARWAEEECGPKALPASHKE